MAMFCTNCGGSFADGDRWCGGCGAARVYGETPVTGFQTQSISQASVPQWVNSLSLPLQQIELLYSIAAAAGILVILFQYSVGYGFDSINRFFFGYNLSLLIGSLGAIAPVVLGIYFQISKSQDARGSVLLRLGALVVSLKGVDFVSQMLDGNWPDAIWRKGIFLIGTVACIVGAIPALLALLPTLKSIPDVLKSFSPKSWALSGAAMLLLVGSALFSRSIALVRGGPGGGFIGGIGTISLLATVALFTILLFLLHSDDLHRVIGTGSVLILHGTSFASSLVLWGFTSSYVGSIFRPEIGSFLYDIFFTGVIVALMFPVRNVFSSKVANHE